MAVPRPSLEEVDQLLLNARLRDELEPYLDESVHVLDCRQMPTQQENEFLASMLAWEKAPILPIAQWFEPALFLPAPDALSELELHSLLWTTIERLYERRITLEFTDHLSDRQLYCLIGRDILPSPEKKLEVSRNYLQWHCLDFDQDAETWLRYYASNEDRRTWAAENGGQLPPAMQPPYPRKMPSRPQ
jgi:hypothetical protein